MGFGVRTPAAPRGGENGSGRRFLGWAGGMLKPLGGSTGVPPAGEGEGGVSRPAPRSGPSWLGAIYTAAGAWRGARAAPARSWPWGRAGAQGTSPVLPGEQPGDPARARSPWRGSCPSPPGSPPPHSPPVTPPPFPTTERPARRGRSQPWRCPRLTHILRPRPRRFPAPPPTARGGGAGGPPEPAPRCPPTGGHRPTGRRGGTHAESGTPFPGLGEPRREATDGAGSGANRRPRAEPPLDPWDAGPPPRRGSPVTVVPRPRWQSPVRAGGTRGRWERRDPGPRVQRSREGRGAGPARPPRVTRSRQQREAAP